MESLSTVRMILRKLPFHRKMLLLRTAARAAVFPHRKLSRPAFLQVEPTTRCNLSCSHCPRVLLDLPGRDMDLSRFRELVDDNPDLLCLHLQGLGEPLLHRDFFDMVEYAVRRDILVGTCTNGHVISPGILESLAVSGLSYLALSIDGVGPEAARLREGSEGQQLTENIAAIAEARNEGTLLAFWVVVQERNLGELDGIIELAGMHGVGHIIFTFVHSTFTTKATGESLLQAQRGVDLKSLRRRLSRKCRRSGMLASFSTTAQSGRLKHCRWPWYASSVSVDGNLLPCCLIYEEHIAGNVFRDKLETLWGNNVYEKFRQDLKTGNLPACCRNCQYL